jgi:peptidoglycan hydrolase-like protein with peptidoglycan-binding domain
MTGNDVKQLQSFLNEQGFTVVKTGPGSPGQETNIFGPATKAALIRFQNTYADDILAPSGLRQGNGVFGPATMKKIQSILNATVPQGAPAPAASTTPSIFTRTLKLGSTGEDVRQLQIFLNKQGFTMATEGPGSTGQETTFFGRGTADALTRFQEAYRKEVLDPQGLVNGTGIFGEGTRGVVNGMVGR